MDIDALKELRARVANGTARTARNTSDFTLAFPDRHEHWHQDPATHATGAYIGFLDAAKDLHEAVLPGWGWQILSDTDVVIFKSSGSEPNTIEEQADTPARAWLLAILDALIAEARA